MLSRFPPRLIPGTLPEEERETVGHLNSTLPNLSKYVSDYENALTLFDFAWSHHQRSYDELTRFRGAFAGAPLTDFEAYRNTCDELSDQMRGYSGWQMIAARDAAMTIFHFRFLLNTITGSVFKSPTLLRLSEEKALRSLMPRFEKHFTKAERTRNAVGHSAELVSTPSKMRENAVSGDRDIAGVASITGGGSLFIGSIMNGRTLTMTIQNDVVSVEVSPQSLQVLKSIRDTLFDALVPAEAELRKRNFEMLTSLAKANREQPKASGSDHQS